MNKMDEERACAQCEDAIMGAGRAVFVCIQHLRLTKEGTAVMHYQIELEGGGVETYEITVKTAQPIIELAGNKTIN